MDRDGDRLDRGAAGRGQGGLDIYTSSTATAASTLGFDRFTVTRLGVTPPANQKPDGGDRDAGDQRADGELSGSGSTDIDGTISELRVELR